MKLFTNFMYTVGTGLALLGGCSMDSDLSVLWLPILWIATGCTIVWIAHRMEVTYDY